MGVLRQLVAGRLHHLIGVAGRVRRHHADVGGHHLGAQLQGQIHNPLGFLDFGWILRRPGEAVSAQIAAQRRHRQPVVLQQRPFLPQGSGRHVFRRHFPVDSVQLYAVGPQRGAFGQRLVQRQAQPVGDNSNLKLHNTSSHSVARRQLRSAGKRRVPAQRGAGPPCGRRTALSNPFSGLLSWLSSHSVARRQLRSTGKRRVPAQRSAGPPVRPANGSFQSPSCSV